MLWNRSGRDHLHAWLVKTLEPICDAEPGALADYVLALLDHDAPEQELRKEFIAQLEEFLENGAADFVDTLFAALRSKSYLPYTDSQPTDNGIPIPLDALMPPSGPDRGRKRSLEQDDQSMRGPAKGPRLNNDSRYPRYPPRNGHLDNDNWSSGGDGSGVSGINVHMGGRGRYPQLNGRGEVPRGICRDYHIKGYCARGAMCKFSHDDAAVAPSQLAFPANALPLAGALPFLPLFPGGIPFPMNDPSNPVYDPHEAHMDMRPGHDSHSQQNALGSYDQLPNDGEARASQLDVQDGNPQERLPEAPGHLQGKTDVPPDGTSMPPAYALRPQSGFRGRGGRGRDGVFPGEHQSFRRDDIRDNKTLVVEKIPEDHLSLEAVNGWFKRFGTVTNVAIDHSTAKALVSFSDHGEAQRAWKAEDAVFNNRFVKIYWHRPMDGQGALGSKLLQASAPIVANIASRETAPQPSIAPPPPSAALRPPKLTALAAKQKLLEKQIAEQKELMARLDTAPPAEKREIMVRLRKLREEMDAANASNPTAAASQPVPPPKPTIVDGQKKAKELLDMELDAHAKDSDKTDAMNTEEEESRESLQKKLALLQAEAASLGITTDPAVPHPPYRPPRGRGRGRGHWGGRGFARGGASLKLDNRPKSLLLQGVDVNDLEAVETIRGWYGVGGQMESLNVQDDSLIILFKTRNAAEQALTKRPDLPTKGPLKVSWHIPTQATNVDLSDKKLGPIQRPPSPRPEETLDESGWGDGEDGMGMF